MNKHLLLALLVAAAFVTPNPASASGTTPHHDKSAQSSGARPQDAEAAWIKFNDAQQQQADMAIQEVEPFLERGPTGLLQLKRVAPPIKSFSPAAQTLYLNATAHLNTAIRSGQLRLDRFLNVTSTSDPVQPLALENLWCSIGEPARWNSNWFSWRWWGYQAGMDHNKTNRIWWYFDNAGVVLDTLGSIGVPVEVAWPFYVWVQAYSYFLHSKDHGGGVVFTATWGNFWCPIVQPQ